MSRRVVPLDGGAQRCVRSSGDSSRHLAAVVGERRAEGLKVHSSEVGPEQGVDFGECGFGGPCSSSRADQDKAPRKAADREYMSLLFQTRDNCSA